MCADERRSTSNAMAVLEARKERLLSVAGKEFKIHQTEHFLIAYDTSFEALADLKGRLETTYDSIWRYIEALELPATAPDQPLEIIFYNDFDDYADLCQTKRMNPNVALGFFDHGTNRSFFSNVLTRPELSQVVQRIEQLTEDMKKARSASRTQGGSRTHAAQLRKARVREMTALKSHRDKVVDLFNRMILRHESTHQLLFNAGVHKLGVQNPDWLVEGLATQFEIPQVWADLGFRNTNHARLADLRSALGVSKDAKTISQLQHQQAIGTGKVLPLQELVTKWDILRSGHTHSSLHYAQSWALVFYLNRKMPAAFRNYVRSIAARPRGQRFTPTQERETFEKSFGPLDADFERNFFAFVLELRLDPTKAGR